QAYLGKPALSEDDTYGTGYIGSASVGPKMASMQGGASQRGWRIVSSSSALVGGTLRPPSDGSRQSPCPANLAAFAWLTQSHTVVMAPAPFGSTSHVPLVHVLHPAAAPSACAAQVAAAAAFG